LADGFFDYNFFIVVSGNFQGIPQFGVTESARLIPMLEPRVRRFDKQRILPERLYNTFERFVGLALSRSVFSKGQEF
jgi:hypothetical protein